MMQEKILLVQREKREGRELEARCKEAVREREVVQERVREMERRFGDLEAQ